MRMNVVILAAGDFPTHPVPLAVLARYRAHLICCDGAADELMHTAYRPRIVIGDGDSISEEARAFFADCLVQETEQETNDLTKAVRYALAHGYAHLHIVGATGKREDHTLGNISLLADYMEHASVEMWTDYGCFTPVTGRQTLETHVGQQLSLFCLDAEPLTLHGVRWPLDRRVITRWWQASLTAALGEQITINTSGKVIVFRKYGEVDEVKS